MYKDVIVVGTGKIARGVLEHVVALKDIYRYEVFYINNGVAIYDSSSTYASQAGVHYMHVSSSQELTKLFSFITKKTLIISAGSFYLFPSAVIEMRHLTIINYHNSILPNYPGRNTPSWVIFNGEKETGITWHLVSTGIDDGDIIHKEYCAINPDEKAYRLVEKLMDLGITGFKKIFWNILNGAYVATPQSRNSNQRIYCAKDIPGDAKCFSEQKGDDIYRLLRALDYGKVNIFPSVTLVHKGVPLKVLRYATVWETSIDASVNTMYFPLSSGAFLRIKYKKA